ncbi:MAG: PaaI family thioesterase [Desulfococcaceae bacterium]
MPQSPNSDDAARAFLERDAFAREMGIELLEARDGEAVARLNITDRHLNGIGLAHGGAIFSLADLAFAAAANSGDAIAAAIHVSIAYIHPGRAGQTLTAHARRTAGGGKMETFQVAVRDETGEILADFQGMAYRKTGRPVETKSREIHV